MRSRAVPALIAVLNLLPAGHAMAQTFTVSYGCRRSELPIARTWNPLLCPFFPFEFN